jgi:hypothetical protein
MKNLLKNYRLEVDKSEVLRAMGYPHRARVSEPVLEVCGVQVPRVGELAAPWGSYCEVRIEGIDGDWVRLESGKALRSHRVAGMLRRARWLKVCLVTLGAPITAEIRRLMAKSCAIEALALDAAATVATNAMMGKLRERICAEAGERHCGTTIAYGPGYTGWDIRDLPVLFSCLGPAASVGSAGPLPVGSLGSAKSDRLLETESLPVRLNEALMMIPEKSLLCVVGVVLGGRAAPEVEPCRLCDLEPCSVRRAPYRRGGKGLRC